MILESYLLVNHKLVALGCLWALSERGEWCSHAFAEVQVPPSLLCAFTQHTSAGIQSITADDHQYHQPCGL